MNDLLQTCITQEEAQVAAEVTRRRHTGKAERSGRRGPRSLPRVQDNGSVPSEAPIISVRVSSDRQKEEQTIASQTSALRAYAAARDYMVPDGCVFDGEGWSGATLVRPGLERLRDLAAQGHMEVVLVSRARQGRGRMPTSREMEKFVSPRLADAP